MPIPAQAIPVGNGQVQIGSLFFPTAPKGYIGDFNRATRQSLVPLPALTPPNPGTAGQISRVQLPTTGFLGGLYLKTAITVTTAGGGSTTVSANQYPTPAWPYIRRARLFNNQNVEIFNLSGYALYVYARMLRSGFDPQTPFGFRSYGSDPAARYFTKPTSIGASATDSPIFTDQIWSAWGYSLQAAMLLLQDPAITYTLEITWGDLTDLYSTTTSATLSAATVTPMCEIYSVPQFADDFPSMSFTKTVTEEIQPLTAGTGDNTLRFVTGNQLTMMAHEIVNNGAPIAPSAVTKLQLQYAQTQIPYVVDPDVALYRQRLLFGQDLPQGWYVWPLEQAMGMPELVSTRDILNTAQLTDLFSVVTLSGVNLTGTQFLRTVKEQLVANR